MSRCCRRNNRDDDCGRFEEDCNRPVRRCLEPVLVARIFNQPIVEEVPRSGMSMRMDHMATIREARTHERPLCDDCEREC